MEAKRERGKNVERSLQVGDDLPASDDFIDLMSTVEPVCTDNRGQRT